jgi:catechol 2,3-dioxygenase
MDSSSAHGTARLADGTRLGPVALVVTDLQRSLCFYSEVIGLAVRSRGAGVAELGTAAATLLRLSEDRRARRPGREAGLYHFALLFPTREELARAGMRVLRARWRIDGASDHGTHEAIYLPDPDGIGVELAADRPRAQWPDYASSEFAGRGPAPLDLRALLGRVAGEPPSRAAGPGLAIGHVHLHVGELRAAREFYCDGLGFEVMAALPTAVFVSFAGYHHQVAFNLWRGRAVPPASQATVGLDHWTLVLADEREHRRVRERLAAIDAVVSESTGGAIVRDPAGIAVALSARQEPGQVAARPGAKRPKTAARV